MQCPDCGAFYTAEDTFCGECGRPLSSQPPPAEPLSPWEAKDLPTVDVSALPHPPAPAPAAIRPAQKARLLPILLLMGMALVIACLCGVGAIVWLRSSDQSPLATSTPPVAVYQDDFDDPGSGWDVYSEDDVLAEYANGEYRLGVYRDNYVTWGNPTPDQDLADITVEVDARQAEGPMDNNLGLLVRYQPDGESFYWFEISGDGYYSIDLRQGGQWVTLQDWETSTAIYQGIGITNRLKVVCAGDRFSFYVNDTFLTEISDSTFSSGSVGLAVGTFDEPEVVVSFDNLEVYASQN